MKAHENQSGATIFGYHVSDPRSYGVVEFDENGLAISLEEKPKIQGRTFAIPGLYFYDQDASSFAKSLSPSPRGELEITDLNEIYLKRGNLSVEVLGRGTAWLDTGSHDSLASATDFVRLLKRGRVLRLPVSKRLLCTKNG